MQALIIYYQALSLQEKNTLISAKYTSSPTTFLQLMDQNRVDYIFVLAGLTL
jgi:hypothetical protein